MDDPRARTALEWLGNAGDALTVGGATRPGVGRMVTHSPSTGAALREVAVAGSDDVDAAVRAAGDALAGKWGDALPAERARVLLRLADLIADNADRLAALEAADGVRSYAEALYGDVPTSAGIFRHMAGLIGAIEGQVLYPSIGYAPPGMRARALVDKQPVGVVAVIVPWNFPLVMACARVAPALAAGCSVILKPAEDTPLSALALGKLAAEAGLPDGVLTVLPGPGETGAALVRHPDVAMVSFTGSTKVGREIGAVAGGLLKKQSLELGGKCSAIVMDDADIDLTAAGLAASSFGNAGQVCVASARLLVHRSVHDALVAKLEAGVRARRIGGTFDEHATMGPIINDRQRLRVAALLDDAVAAGARLSGSCRVEGPGCFLNLVIVTDLSASARLHAEETFGPVVTVEPFDELDEAIARANRTEYGLAGSIWTGRWRDADHAARRLAVGTVYVNCHAYADPAVPMGGLKGSGVGLQSGRAGLESHLSDRVTLAML